MINYQEYQVEESAALLSSYLKAPEHWYTHHRVYSNSVIYRIAFGEKPNLNDDIKATSGLPADEMLTNHPFKASNGTRYEYLCWIKTPRYALNGPYAVYVFRNNAGDEPPSRWATNDALIGVLGIPAGGSGMYPHILVVGAMPMTRALQELMAIGDADLVDMREESYVPFLSRHLTSRVSKDGLEVDVGNIPRFQVSVYSSTSTPPTAGSLPKWSTFIPHTQVTKGKAGGIQPADADLDLPTPDPSDHDPDPGTSYCTY